MKVLLLALAICASPLLAQKPEATVTSSQPAAHVSNSFTFTVNAPLREAAPLFGPEGERAWAGDDWNPEFVFPVPAQDVEGAVFTLRHGEHTAVWVNTLFDLSGGRMQYVYVLGDLLVTTIDVRLHAIDAGAHEGGCDLCRARRCGPRRMSMWLRWGSTTENRGRYGRKRSIVICSGRMAPK